MRKAKDVVWYIQCTTCGEEFVELGWRRHFWWHGAIRRECPTCVGMIRGRHERR
jgi:hypothetical protein